MRMVREEIDTSTCACHCGCQTHTVTLQPLCTFCRWEWHQGDHRRFHGAMVTNGLSVKALRKAHPNQLKPVRQAPAPDEDPDDTEETT